MKRILKEIFKRTDDIEVKRIRDQIIDRRAGLYNRMF